MSSSATEAQRLRVLRDLNILDSEPEERFDRITRLAARLFQVPMAFVSLVDADRLWFKSRVGFPDAETPSAQTFCTHAIRQDEMLVVCDALADGRLADSPYVRGFPHVRFYAGQPIAVDGVYIGTLCVADMVAREFGEQERSLLRDLAHMVANEVAADALKTAQLRVHRSESSLRALLDHLPDSVLLLDEAGAVVSCNPAAQQLFGMDAAQLAGRAAASLLGLASGLPDSTARPVRIDASVTRTGAPVTVEAAFSALEIDGRRHLVLSIRDVSAHRAALEAERAAEQRRRTYFRTATHELRTPMASILGFSELLMKRDFDADTGRELLGIIHKQASRLVDVINQMLDRARIEAGGPEEQRRCAVDLEALLGHAIAATAAPERAADIAVASAPQLATVAANPARLQQAVANVIDNALRFSPPGSRVEIALASEERGGRHGASIAIRDHGIGMTPAQQAQMFDAFYRTGEQPEAEGTGLGLTLARDIVAAHEGSIEVASRPGAGTTVTIWVPNGGDAA